MEILLTFENTHGAIEGEKVLIKEALNPRVMPLPPVVKSGCGIALRLENTSLKKAEKVLSEEGISYNIYTIQGEKAQKSYLYHYETPLAKALGIHKKDIISIVGCGGKTTCMYLLAKELKDQKVMVSTTTNIMIPKLEEDLVDYIYDDTNYLELNEANVGAGRYLVYGGKTPRMKCRSLEEDELKKVSSLFDVVIIEADGSRTLPVKGYREYEPCTPPFATVTVGILPLWSLGNRIDDQTVHRVEEFCNMTGASKGDVLTPKHLARVIVHPDGMYKGSLGRKILFFNQVENEQTLNLAKEVLKYIPKEEKASFDQVIAASMHEQKYMKL